MPNLQFIWEPSPDVVADDYKKFSNELRNLKKPLSDSISEVLAPSIEDRFNSEGPGWAPLASYTVSKKGHEDILIDSGKLAQSASSTTSWQVTATDANLNKVPDYAIYQNMGYFNVPFNVSVPARVFAAFEETQIEQTVEVFEKWLLDAWEDIR